MFYVILLAMVACFLGLRLYSVLGKRTGHEQPLPRAAEERTKPVTLPRTVEMQAETPDLATRNIEPSAEQGLRAIVAAEPGFDVNQFQEGARSAYRMVLEAFWRADEAELAELCEDDVRASFVDAIVVRTESGHVLQNRLVSIEKTKIVDAALTGRDARITVQFDADIAAVTRDAEGQVIAGSLTDAVQTHDVWTFSRTLKSTDPNWMLADTDEA